MPRVCEIVPIGKKIHLNIDDDTAGYIAKQLHTNLSALHEYLTGQPMAAEITKLFCDEYFMEIDRSVRFNLLVYIISITLAIILTAATVSFIWYRKQPSVDKLKDFMMKNAAYAVRVAVAALLVLTTILPIPVAYVQLFSSVMRSLYMVSGSIQNEDRDELATLPAPPVVEFPPSSVPTDSTSLINPGDSASRGHDNLIDMDAASIRGTN